ncbi:hypothetical protein, partial [Salmonella enterica]|uniref:hypothetical protein n=1 Tax=Salmonella enterica TaxID=28901 RepID=UPI003D2AE7BA
MDSISCFNSHDGKVIIQMNAGTPPYTYNWLPALAGNVIDSITNLGPGTYTVMVSDSMNCIGRDTVTL